MSLTTARSRFFTGNRQHRRGMATSLRKRGRGYTTSAKTIKDKPDAQMAAFRWAGARGFKFPTKRKRKERHV